MEVLSIGGTVPEWLAPELTEFEEQFSYPLGEGETFHVSHGGEYLRFFDAMGVATLFVAVRVGKVLGTLVGVRRTLREGDGAPRAATYLADLKVRPGPLRGRVFLALGRALERSWREAGGGVGYAVVMNGTAQTPAAYTGRGLLPGFVAVGELIILRLATSWAGHEVEGVRGVSMEALLGAFADLTTGGRVPLGGVPLTRASMLPTPLVLGEPVSACGLVEDTRRGKRLLVSGGSEMKSAHLSHFAFTSAPDGARLIRAALCIAAREGFPALFVSVPKARAAELAPCLNDLVPTVAPATVYGHEMESGCDGEWWVHSSEI